MSCHHIVSVNSSASSEESWLGPIEPEGSIPLSRFIVVVFTVALILILVGAPITNPLAFLSILIFVVGFGLICAYFNKELAQSLRVK